MFDSTNAIADVVCLLERRQASLWHACQLTDFRSYVSLGAVPSRQQLEREHLPFTGFESDRQDRGNGVWDKVFYNLSDFGWPFAHGRAATPTVYGPIALQLAPHALRHCQDVAISLRSAGGKRFDRAGESLTRPEELERLYVHGADAGFPKSTFLKSRADLATAFPSVGHASWPEISCTVPQVTPRAGSKSSFEPLIVVWVDPISIRGKPLVDSVRSLMSDAGMRVPVRIRSITDERRRVAQDIVNQLANGYVTLRLLAGRHGISPQTVEWSTAVEAAGLSWQWDRYARYLSEGTLAHLSAPYTQSDRDRRSVQRHSRSPNGGAPSVDFPIQVAEILHRFKEQ